MSHKNETTCWCCGSHAMEKTDAYFKCRSCMATWNEPPHIAPAQTFVESKIPIRPGERHAIKGFAPSKTSAREAARARGEPPPERRPKKAARQ